MGWVEFIAAFGVFFITHTVPIRPPLRPKLVQVLGPRGFSLFYSILSLSVLVWLIIAAGRAPFVEIWPYAPWQRAVPQIAMAVVCVVVALGMSQPNPLSFGGRPGMFDPDNPGIVRWVRHPILAALALWSLAHLVPNGDLAHVILFGVFATFALLGGRLMDRRKRRDLGDQWQILVDQIAATPLVPTFGTGRFLLRILIAIGLYLALIFIHPFWGIDVRFF